MVLGWAVEVRGVRLKNFWPLEFEAMQKTRLQVEEIYTKVPNISFVLRKLDSMIDTSAADL
jgi:hypothetical protein